MRQAFFFLAFMFFAPLSAQSAEMQPIRTLSVNGMAERKVTPDEAHLNVNLNSMNLQLTTAKAEHDKKLRQLMAITEKNGIDKAKIKTQLSSVQPEYRYENNQRSFKGYKVQTVLDITVKPIEKVGMLMEQIVTANFEKGANTEWGDLLTVSYAVSNPEKIRDEMTTDAIKNARAKADRMAAALDAKIARVYQLQEGAAPSFGYQPPMPMMAMMKSADSAERGVSPPPGEQNVQATVSVIFELKD